MKSISLLILVLTLSVVPVRPALAETNTVPTNSWSQLNAVKQILDDAQSGKYVYPTLPTNFSIKVDYDLPLDQAFAESGCKIFDSVTPLKVSPGIVLHGQTNVEIILLQFDHPMQPKEMLSELDHRGLRPANLVELVALAKQFPKQDKDFEIVTQGAYCLAAPFIDWLLTISDTAGNREVAVTQFYLQPQKWQWFAAVRK